MAEDTKAGRWALAPIVISIVAVVLSQMKPLYTYFEKPNLDLVVGRNMTLFETWGNLTANLFVQLVNKGGAGGVVERMDIFIKSKDTGYAHVMPAQTYYLQPEAISRNEIVAQIPFSNITVPSDTIWSGFIASFSSWSRTQSATISEITKKTQIEINSKYVPNGPAVTIGTDLMSRIRDFTRGNLGRFDIGEYQLLVLAWSQGSNTPTLRKAFNFSVFESDVARLFVKEEGYPYGSGILFPIDATTNQQAVFNVTLDEIEDQEMINRLYMAYEQAQL